MRFDTGNPDSPVLFTLGSQFSIRISLQICLKIQYQARYLWEQEKLFDEIICSPKVCFFTCVVLISLGEQLVNLNFSSTGSFAKKYLKTMDEEKLALYDRYGTGTY